MIGSGIMGEKLAGGNDALALLGNTLPTGAILVVLITMLGPVSGAHFNPAVTGVFLAAGRIDRRLAVAYVVAQSRHAVVGVFAAHPCSSCPCCSCRENTKRSGAMARRGHRNLRTRADDLGDPQSRGRRGTSTVGLYIIAAYWFTASTSFANTGRDHCSCFLGHLRRYPAGGRRRPLLRRKSSARYPGCYRPVALRTRARKAAWKRPYSRNKQMSITIYHYPSCGTSRNTFAMIPAVARSRRSSSI